MAGSSSSLASCAAASSSSASCVAASPSRGMVSSTLHIHLHRRYEVHHVRVLALSTSLAAIFYVLNVRLKVSLLLKVIRGQVDAAALPSQPPRPPSLSSTSPSGAYTWSLTLQTFSALSRCRRFRLAEGHRSSKGHKFASPGWRRMKKRQGIKSKDRRSLTSAMATCSSVTLGASVELEGAKSQDLARHSIIAD
ncbi:hypothetical protein Cgig2_029790 [Carnegiea gigantea]|uniref:Uncharacterized protein n=1 Tax=Carnegiea gigantea TaxID=171969 RepID=A0A9Q1KJW8_9CARY|nr:hypothetical protein Cgig2_029790 [Carnegiea gigantea]